HFTERNARPVRRLNCAAQFGFGGDRRRIFCERARQIEICRDQHAQQYARQDNESGANGETRHHARDLAAEDAPIRRGPPPGDRPSYQAWEDRGIVRYGLKSVTLMIAPRSPSLPPSLGYPVM